ncbi:hypothetical protein Salat_2907300 [Sesamum alatum]|uniref:Uncharacterized protein n=1 Tax=Sesamum alatum TaxID=300844 RepID=A0AAE1XJK1_9LAMI|nr:hypothetical protein Salat_2907300 [Sesamum alatum]
MELVKDRATSRSESSAEYEPEGGSRSEGSGPRLPCDPDEHSAPLTPRESPTTPESIELVEKSVRSLMSRRSKQRAASSDRSLSVRISITLFYKYEDPWPTFAPCPRRRLRFERHPWCDLLAFLSSISTSSLSCKPELPTDFMTRRGHYVLLLYPKRIRPNLSFHHPSIRGCSPGTLGTSTGPNPPIPPDRPSFLAVEIVGEETELAARTQPYSPKPHSPKPLSKGKEVAEGPIEPKKRKRKNHSKASEVRLDQRRGRRKRLLKRLRRLRTSVLKTLVGQDSWELYRSCLLPRDQAVLAPTAHAHVKEHHAHAFTREEGFIASREADLFSVEHQKFISDTRLPEARDFLKSLAFKVAIELDATLDDNLAAFPEEEAPPIENDEF